MKRPFGFIFQTLKGSEGLSKCPISRLDVSRIQKIQYRKRLFRIFDRDKPFTLQVEYFSPHNVRKINPTIMFLGSGGIGASLGSEVENTEIITKRYSTEKDVKKEISQYKKNIRLLDTIVDDMRKAALTSRCSDYNETI